VSLAQLFDWPANRFPAVAVDARPLVGHFHEYLLRGGFPQSALMASIPQAQKLLREDIVDKGLKRDMTALFGVRRVPELEQTFLYLCLHDGSLLDIPGLCKSLEVTKPAAKWISAMSLPRTSMTSASCRSSGRPPALGWPKSRRRSPATGWACWKWRRQTSNNAGMNQAETRAEHIDPAQRSRGHFCGLRTISVPAIPVLPPGGADGPLWCRAVAPGPHRRATYEALRAFFVEELPGPEVARRFGYSPNALRVLCYQFRHDPDKRCAFFQQPKPGPRHAPTRDRVRQLAVALRKQNLSIYDLQLWRQAPDH